MQTLIDGDLVPLEGDVVHFVRQLVEGLAYLHQRNIAHLDIKVSSTHKRSKRTCHASRISGSRNRAPLSVASHIVPIGFSLPSKTKILLAFSGKKSIRRNWNLKNSDSSPIKSIPSRLIFRQMYRERNQLETIRSILVSPSFLLLFFSFDFFIE